MAERTKIMISYAHEDVGFAKALRDDLKRDYEVWFDEDELKVGDSLFEQINRGLGACDYGVVVLSPNYFGKTWTTRELSGLMAVEERTKKVLLPVWLNIDRDGVKKFSPIMADRMAAKAEDGIATVTALLRSAIDAATRAVGLATRSAASAQLAALGRDFHNNANAETRLRTTEGVDQLNAAFKQLIDQLESGLKSAESPGLRFNISRKNGELLAHTRARLILSIRFAPQYVNHALNTVMRVGIFQRADEFGPFEGSTAPALLDELSFSPWFVDGEVVWKLSSGVAYTSDQVVEATLSLLHRILKSVTST